MFIRNLAVKTFMGSLLFFERPMIVQPIEDILRLYLGSDTVNIFDNLDDALMETVSVHFDYAIINPGVHNGPRNAMHQFMSALRARSDCYVLFATDGSYPGLDKRNHYDSLISLPYDVSDIVDRIQNWRARG